MATANFNQFPPILGTDDLLADVERRIFRPGQPLTRDSFREDFAAIQEDLRQRSPDPAQQAVDSLIASLDRSRRNEGKE